MRTFPEPAQATEDRSRLIRSLARRYERALVGIERSEAIECALEALELTQDPAQVYARVIQPAMHQIGKLWELGELTVAEEHVATAMSSEVVALVAPPVPEQPEPRGRALLSAVEGEYHVVGLRMIGYLLEGRGYTVEFIGTGVPTEDLMSIVRHRNPSLVGLSISSEGRAPALRSAMEALADSNTPVLIGGAGVPASLRGDRLPYVRDAQSLPV